MVKMEGIFRAATVLSALMKVYTFPCHDTGHINVMLVLQSCTDPLHVLPGLSSETFPTSPDGTCDVSITAVQRDVVVIEEGFIAVNEEAPTGIKQEEIPEDIPFQDIKAEPDEVSYMCVCVSVIRHILPVSRNVSCFCDANISGHLKQLHCWEWICFAVIDFFFFFFFFLRGHWGWVVQSVLY